MTSVPEPISADAASDLPFDARAGLPDSVGAWPQARPGRRLLPRFLLAFVLGLLAALALGAGALNAYDQAYHERILPGVHVGSVNLSGLTADEAAARLHAEYDRLGEGNATIVIGAKRIEMPFDRAKRLVDIDATVAQALSVGRAGNVVERVVANVRTAVRGVDVAPRLVYDRQALTSWLSAIAAANRVEPVDATVTRTKDGFSVKSSAPGRRPDPAPAVAALADQLGRLDAPAQIQVEMPFVEVPPAITTDEAEAAQAAAARMSADLVVRGSDTNWTIPKTSLERLISFAPDGTGTLTPVLNASGLDKVLKSLAMKVNRSPKDAGLKVVNGHVVVTSKSHEGRTLNAAGMKAALVKEVEARRLGAASSPVPAVVKAVDPKLSTDDANAYASKMRVISSFSIYYFVIVNNHFGGNIEAPATKINGTVVPAGTVFDFWKVVGDLRKLPGTGPGNAIEGGKITVTGAFGGGICTTSTTLFNAAFRAGMIPMARQNHNEFINRYPPGLDATVWIVGSTKQTMSFKNDTKYPILITRSVTQDGNRRWLTFKIWSVPNGRTYKITNQVIQPGQRAIDTVVHDPTKPVGYAFRNNTPVDGAKVWVTVSIYDHGKLHWSKRYFSNYPAVNGVLVVGTKKT